MDELKEIITKQKSLLSDLESLSRQYDVKELLTQNKALNAELQNCKKELATLDDRCKNLMSKNEDLNFKLTEQILDERSNILKISREKMEVYFRKNSQTVKNELNSLEQNYIYEIKKIRYIIEDELGKEDLETLGELDDMLGKIKNKVEQKRQQLAGAEVSLNKKMQTAYKTMEAEGLSQEQIKNRIRQNNFEIKIGLDIINKIGIFLIILGAATAIRYTYSKWFNNTTRAVFIFVLGALFIAAGEWFVRKKKTTFAVGLNGGGTAILYYAVFSSYFFLDVINMNVALVTSILITALTVFFALRYNSKTTVSFALIGGYLPFFSYVFAFGLNETGIYGAMIYLFLLNASLVYISFYKRWSFSNYLSFILNIPVLVYLISICTNQMINIVYCMSTFFLYLSVTLIYPLSYKIKLKKADIVILTVNTLGSCIIVYGLFDRANLNNYRGLLALIFCIVYFSLGSFTNKFMKNEKDTTLLFYLTSITFAVLAVPFQFDITWITLGWLIEGVLMIILGYVKKSVLLEKSGWIVFAICILAFYLIDFPQTEIFGDSKYVHWKFGAITASSLGVLYFYIKDNINNTLFKYTAAGRVVTGFKYFTIVNTWIYLMFESNTLYHNYFINYDFNDFYFWIRFALINILMVFVLERIKVIQDKVTDYLAVLLDIIVILSCLLITADIHVLYEDIDNYKKILSFIVLLLNNAYVYYALRKLSIKLFSIKRLNFEFYPVFMGFYTFIIFNLFMTCQFQREYSSLLISFGYMVLAFLLIIYGFVRKFIYIRRMGLFLSLLANAKLFFYDLSYLDMVFKIVAYFSFGLVMLAISYVYQQLKKKLGGD